MAKDPYPLLALATAIVLSLESTPDLDYQSDGLPEHNPTSILPYLCFDMSVT